MRLEVIAKNTHMKIKKNPNFTIDDVCDFLVAVASNPVCAKLVREFQPVNADHLNIVVTSVDLQHVHHVVLLYL